FGISNLSAFKGNGMRSNFLRAIAANLAAAATLGLASVSASAVEPIKMAVTNWADVLALANIAKYVPERDLKQPVDFVQADIGIQYQGLARGDLDIMVGGWLPVAHAAYYAKYKNDLEDTGIIYAGAKNGWAVPDYVPENEVSSISDLNKPEVKSKLN